MPTGRSASNANHHCIRKQTIHLSLMHKGESPFFIQQRLTQALEQYVYPQLEAVFDNLAGPDHYIELDTLDIDLGDIDLKQPEHTWVKPALERFKQSLEKALETSHVTTTHGKQTTNLLQYFLQYGHFPWWAKQVDLEQNVKSLISHNAANILHMLHNKAARIRWCHQLSDHVQDQLLNAVRAKPPVTLLEWQALFLAPQQVNARLSYWCSVWDAVLNGATCFSRDGDINKLVWQKKLIEDWLALQKAIGDAQTRTPSNLITKFWAMQAWHQAAAQVQNERVRPENNLRSIRAPANQKLPDPLKEAIFVSLAGTVLVHPFLPTLFTKLDLLNGDRFIDRQAQAHAIHILHYVAIGQLYPPEHELVLLKLLCGYALTDSIPRHIDLSERDKNESNRMLMALIEHWPVLKGSTPEELRNTFFMREGKLEKTSMGWGLHIEQTGVDILLGKLNWGLSPILHPWMAEMLWVDWA